MTVATVAGVLAGAVGTIDALPYLRDVLRGVTRPHRGTWLVWSVLAIVVCASQRADGATWSLVMTAEQALATVLIFALALRCGEAGASRGDLLCIAVAGCGIAGWVLSDEPLVATACVVVADLVGVALMVPKTYRDPDSETLSTFVLAGVSGGLAAIAVGALDVALLLYPAYFAVGNAGIAVLIIRRRRVRPSA